MRVSRWVSLVSTLVLLPALPAVFGACTPAATVAEPQVPSEPPFEPPQVDTADGAPSFVRPGTPGALVFFVRGLAKRETRDKAAAAAEALVSECDPALDVVVVLEPGLAAMWTGFARKTEEELKSHRETRARCLQQRAFAAPDVDDQITLVMDEKGELRRELLDDGDPGDDLVLGAYTPKGRAIYKAGIPNVSGTDGVRTVVVAARAALKRAREENATLVSRGPALRASP